MRLTATDRCRQLTRPWPFERVTGSVGYGAKTVVNGGSELLIFDRPGKRDQGQAVTLTPADVLIAPG
jgi:hypothetical protein